MINGRKTRTTDEPEVEGSADDEEKKSLEIPRRPKSGLHDAEVGKGIHGKEEVVPGEAHAIRLVGAEAGDGDVVDAVVDDKPEEVEKEEGDEDSTDTLGHGIAPPAGTFEVVEKEVA